jgi:hypothetical protein
MENLEQIAKQILALTERLTPTEKEMLNTIFAGKVKVMPDSGSGHNCPQGYIWSEVEGKCVLDIG